MEATSRSRARRSGPRRAARRTGRRVTPHVLSRLGRLAASSPGLLRGSTEEPIRLASRAVSLDDDFQAAQARVKQLAQTPPPDQLLELYSLYKQATEGDVQGSRPGMLDFKGRAKYDAWAGRRGIAKAAAQQAYVDLVKRLVERQG